MEYKLTVCLAFFFLLFQADADGPDFVTTYNSTKQNIDVSTGCIS